MKIITKTQVDTIINDYTTNLIPMIDIAKQYGVTRQGIHKVLKRAGVDTTKHRIRVTCYSCGVEVLRHRCQIRNRKRLFCSEDCYHTFLGAITENTYKPWRQGQRVAREVISGVFDLLPGHVVHHIDNNNWNNGLDNLIVFANQGDHIRFHRGFEAHPIYPPR